MQEEVWTRGYPRRASSKMVVKWGGVTIRIISRVDFKS